MPIAAAANPRQRRPPRGLLGVALTLATVTLLSACGDGASVAPSLVPSVQPSASLAAASGPGAESAASLEAAVLLCEQIGAVAERAAAVRAVELRLPNRVALDIELGKLQAVFAELEQTDLGSLEDRLESPLRRLGYRLGELELAVEDFRTNSRPQRAVEHVQTDAQTFSDEVSAFAILARCG